MDREASRCAAAERRPALLPYVPLLDAPAP